MARSRIGIPAGRIKVDTYREYMTILQGLSGGEEWDPSESVRPLTSALGSSPSLDSSTPGKKVSYPCQKVSYVCILRT